MVKPTAVLQDQFFAALKTAKNRLEYLTQNDWSLVLDRARSATFPSGATLIQQGKETKAVYVLVSGRARIEAGSRLVAKIGPGEICGEMAFLESGVASATVTTEEEVKAYALDWAVLGEMFELFPHMASRFYRSLAVSLSRRLREQISSGKKF